jgi:predicted permease
MNAVGRMKPGVRPALAAADFKVIAERLARQFPDVDKDWHITIQPLREEIVGRSRTMLWVLFGAVVLVLLIGCVNVANLLLARALKREREMAVRAAVGAGRCRIIRQLLTESLLLAAVSSAAGILLAKWAVSVLARLSSEQLPRLQTVTLDVRVLLFTLAVALATGLLFGLAPALQAGKINFNGLLKEGGRAGAGARHGRLRDVLVAVEVGLALLLVVGTGLLARSFWQLRQTAPGFNPERVLTAVVSLPHAGYNNATNVAAFHQRLLERLAARTGVEAAGLTSDLPWTGYDENSSFDIEGKTFPPNEGAGGRYHFVSSDYFRAIGVPLVAGRFFNSDDRLGTRATLLVNRSLADRYWPGDSAVGKRITFSPNPKEEDWGTIVGVVGDVKDFPNSPAAVPAFYLPLARSPVRQITLAVRTSADPMAMVGVVREAIQALDKSVPLASVRTLETVTAAAGAERRFTLGLVGGFAATALGLAAIGIYGVLSYLVAQRTREIGIRMALGAQARDVIRLTLKQGMRPVLIGVALGLAGAFALTRLMSSLLFGVGATDPRTFAVSALLVIVAAFLPCWLPARRATRLDPMVALRSE